MGGSGKKGPLGQVRVQETKMFVDCQGQGEMAEAAKTIKFPPIPPFFFLDCHRLV